MPAQVPIPRNDSRAVEWFTALATAYRTQAKAQPKVVVNRVHGSQRLGARTQFAHVWLKLHPPIDCHFVLVTHFADLPDKHVESWGPVEPKDLDRVMQEFDQLEWYHRPVPKQRRGLVWAVEPDTGHGLLHEQVDLHLRGLYDEVRMQQFHPREREDAELHLQGVNGNFGFCRFIGNLFARDPEQSVAYYFREAADNVKRIREYRRTQKDQPPPSYPPEPGISGYTAVLFPARHIGKNPARTISERFWGKHPWGAPGNIVLDRTYTGVRAFATYEGLVAAVLPKKKAARDFLNMACFALKQSGIGATFLRPRDVAPFGLRPEKEKDLEFYSHSYPPEDRPTADKSDRLFLGTSMVPLTKVDRAFRRASKLVKDPDLESFTDLFEAESQLEEERFRQAFFLAWTLVERRLGEVWEILLLRAVGKKPEGDVSVEWRPTLIAGALGRAGLLSAPLLGKVRELNTKRNRILHGKVATKKDSEAMLSAARQAIRELRAAQRRLRRRRPGSG